jgi:hypothetical protein
MYLEAGGENSVTIQNCDFGEGGFAMRVRAFVNSVVNIEYNTVTDFSMQGMVFYSIDNCDAGVSGNVYYNLRGFLARALHGDCKNY